MFDIEKLQTDKVREIVLTVACVESLPGQEPTITIHLTDEIRKRERQLNAKYNRFILTTQAGSQEGTIRSDKQGYCEEMVDLCIKDSKGLFSKDGQPIIHKNEYLKGLLRRYPKFLDWFADALTVALQDDEAFKQAFQGELEKNL